MQLEGILYVSGPHALRYRIEQVLDQVYPYDRYPGHFADDLALYALAVPYPVGPVYTQLAVLADLGVTGEWYAWRDGQPFEPSDMRWVF